MTYQLYYTITDSNGNNRYYCLFNIEFYLARNKIKSDRWYSKLEILPKVKGLAMFLKEKFEDKEFDLENFIDDSELLEELGYLYDQRVDNMPRLMTDAQNYHYNVLGKNLRSILDDFCTTYNMFLKID